MKVTCGVTELVEDGVTGLLVDERGDSFVAAGRRLAVNQESWQWLSQKARDKVRRDDSNKVYAARREELFRELQAGGGAAGFPKIPL